MTKEKKKRGPGRPPKIEEKDWKKVEFFIQAHNTARQIAAYFLMDEQWFCNVFQKRYKMNFQKMQQLLVPKGKLNLRSKRYEMAMSGNVKMLADACGLYLEEDIEKRKEMPEQNEELERAYQSLDILMKQIKELQSRNLKNEDNQIINESKS